MFDDDYGDSKFNQPVNNLPNSIVNLTFGYYFNQEIMLFIMMKEYLHLKIT